MPSLKAIRTRIASVKSTQKITRAMKMVAGARLNRAQQRIVTMRPYAVKTHQLLAACTAGDVAPQQNETAIVKAEAEEAVPATGDEAKLCGHPLLARRAEKSVLFLVLTSDRGLCGAFNTNINRAAEREWHSRQDAGLKVQLGIIGRKARDYFRRRQAPIFKVYDGVWDSLDLERARMIGKSLIEPFLKGEVDAIYLVYNEFKSAMTQSVTVEPLLPVLEYEADAVDPDHVSHNLDDFIFEPNRQALLDRLVPMYVEISILRALLESNAGEHGARMTAMDAATKNAKEMIANLTLQYNRARQAAITKELGEIIGGAEALKG
jgi:F-type H+-transporting ATPase subunit gamma